MLLFLIGKGCRILAYIKLQLKSGNYEKNKCDTPFFRMSSVFFYLFIFLLFRCRCTKKINTYTYKKKFIVSYLAEFSFERWNKLYREKNNSVEAFNIFGNSGKVLARIRDICLKRNAETLTDRSYKQLFFKTCLKKSPIAVITQINNMNNQGSIFFLRRYVFFADCFTDD